MNPRRTIVAALLTAALTAASTACSTTQPTAPTAPTAPERTAEPAPPSADAVDVSADLMVLEQEFDARVGVSAIDTATGVTVAHRADERFGYASTLKALAAGEFLHDVPADQRDERVTWTGADIAVAGYSPMTTERLTDGATIVELAEASVRVSDNTALNLVLKRLGGPSALDAGLERLGDTTSEVVNVEDDLNDIEPGSTEDTSTPAAFTSNLRELVTGDYLAEQDRDLLLDWMSGNATGDTLIRAGAPSGWSVADKSGGAGGIRNDVAVVTPPGRAPIIVTVFTARNDPAMTYDDSLVARTADVVLAALD